MCYVEQASGALRPSVPSGAALFVKCVLRCFHAFGSSPCAFLEPLCYPYIEFNVPNVVLSAAVQIAVRARRHRLNSVFELPAATKLMITWHPRAGLLSRVFLAKCCAHEMVWQTKIAAIELNCQSATISARSRRAHAGPAARSYQRSHQGQYAAFESLTEYTRTPGNRGRSMYTQAGYARSAKSNARMENAVLTLLSCATVAQRQL